MNRLRLFVLLVGMLIARVAHAGTAYTVCSTGADYTTCPACIAAITTGAGDSCLFCDETFTDMCGTTTKGTFTLAPNIAGGAHRAVDTAGNVTAAHPKFNGQWNGTTGANKFFYTTDEYIQIDGLELYGFKEYALYTFRSKISNTYVHDCDSATGGSNAAVWVRTSSNSYYNPAISNVIIDAGYGTLTAGTRAAYGLVIDSVINRSDTVDGLTVFGATNDGLNSGVMTGYVLKNVLSYENGGDGVSTSTGFTCEHITAVGNGSDGILCPHVKYSISTNNTSRGICATTKAANVYNANGSTVGACTAQEGDAVNDDPEYKDSAADDYRLCDTSPAVDLAAASTVTTDLEGSARTDPEDSGCYEPAISCAAGGGALGSRVTNGTLGDRATGGVLGNRVE